MSERALIQGKIYTFLETLPALDQDERLILCTNDSDEKYVCTIRLWQESLILPEETALVHSGSRAKEKIDFFSLYSKEEKICMHGGITVQNRKKRIYSRVQT